MGTGPGALGPPGGKEPISAESCNVTQIINHESVPERHTVSGGTETGQANTVRLSGVQSLVPGLVRLQNRVVVKRSSRETVERPWRPWKRRVGVVLVPEGGSKQNTGKLEICGRRSLFRLPNRQVPRVGSAPGRGFEGEASGWRPRLSAVTARGPTPHNQLNH